MILKVFLCVSVIFSASNIHNNKYIDDCKYGGADGDDVEYITVLLHKLSNDVDHRTDR